MVIFGQKGLYSGKSGFIRAKKLCLGKIGCIFAKWLSSGKVDEVGKSACNRLKVVAFG